eukprot:SAG31_NODE_365_length_16833_cov_98.502032_2_plen_645_part_00
MTSVCNAGDPSVNHLFIIDGNLSPSASHQYAGNTDNDHDRVEGIGSGSVLLYLLYSSTSGGCHSNDQHRAIFEAAVMSMGVCPESGGPVCMVGDMAEVEAVINNPHRIIFDNIGDGIINDGGGDMYDGGNRMSTSMCGEDMVIGSGETVTLNTDGYSSFTFSSLNISAGGMLTAVGSQPLVIDVEGDCWVAGSIDVSGGDGLAGEEQQSGGGGGAGGGALKITCAGALFMPETGVISSNGGDGGPSAGGTNQISRLGGAGVAGGSAGGSGGVRYSNGARPGLGGSGVGGGSGAPWLRDATGSPGGGGGGHGGPGQDGSCTTGGSCRVAGGTVYGDSTTFAGGSGGGGSAGGPGGGGSGGMVWITASRGDISGSIRAAGGSGGRDSSVSHGGNGGDGGTGRLLLRGVHRDNAVCSNTRGADTADLSASYHCTCTDHYALDWGGSGECVLNCGFCERHRTFERCDMCSGTPPTGGNCGWDYTTQVCVDTRDVEYDLANNGIAESCGAFVEQGHTTSGLHRIRPNGYSEPIIVYCDQVTDGGGWILALISKNGNLEGRESNWFPRAGQGSGGASDFPKELTMPPGSGNNLAVGPGRPFRYVAFLLRLLCMYRMKDMCGVTEGSSGHELEELRSGEHGIRLATPWSLI